LASKNIVAVQNVEREPCKMNDFTKEELKILKAALGEIMFFEQTPRLLTKLQSMIDNYCDHSLKEVKTPFFDSIRCEKCKVVF
jgi:hypothetical protein